MGSLESWRGEASGCQRTVERAIGRGRAGGRRSARRNRPEARSADNRQQTTGGKASPTRDQGPALERCPPREVAVVAERGRADCSLLVACGSLVVGRGCAHKRGSRAPGQVEYVLMCDVM